MGLGLLPYDSICVLCSFLGASTMIPLPGDGCQSGRGRERQMRSEGQSLEGLLGEYRGLCHCSGLAVTPRLDFFARSAPSVLWWPRVGPAYSGKPLVSWEMSGNDFENLDESLA